MKNQAIFFSLMLFFIPLLSASAQLECEDTNNNDKGERIESEIEHIVHQITNKWNTEDNTEIAEEDSFAVKADRSLDITGDETENNAQTFSGNKVIEESETITGNVVVKGGDLTIYGTVDGDVLVVGGDLLLRPTGKITGNAQVINGSILKDDGAVIKGYEDKTSAKKASYREQYKKFSRSGRSFDVPWLKEQMNLDNFIFRYNRVESIFLGVGSEKKFYWDGQRSWNAYGSIGWGFKSHTWRGNMGLTRQFVILSDKGSSIIELGAEGYSLTDTKDQWIISLHENTAASLLIHEDFRDYFERAGYTFHTAYYSKHDYLKSELKIEYLADTYYSLTNRVDWAFFGGTKKFRENLAIDPGKMNSVIFSGGISTMTKTSYGPEGWGIHASTEYGKKNLGSEFEFDRYVLDIRRFQPLGRHDNLNIRIRVGSLAVAYGDTVRQKSFELGGLGTLSAFPFKSETGNRMLLINSEFIINGSFFDELDFWPSWLFSNFNFLFTSDAGFTREVSPQLSALDGFEKITWNEFKHCFGVALTNRSGSFRIGFSWRTDHPAPVQFILRFNRPF